MAAGWNSQPLESSVHAPKTLDGGGAEMGDWSARGGAAVVVLPAARYEEEDASSAKGFSKRSDIWDLRVG